MKEGKEDGGEGEKVRPRRTREVIRGRISLSTRCTCAPLLKKKEKEKDT